MSKLRGSRARQPLEPELLELVKLRAISAQRMRLLRGHAYEGRDAIGVDPQRLHLTTVWKEAPVYSRPRAGRTRLVRSADAPPPGGRTRRRLPAGRGRVRPRRDRRPHPGHRRDQWLEPLRRGAALPRRKLRAPGDMSIESNLLLPATADGIARRLPRRRRRSARSLPHANAEPTGCSTSSSDAGLPRSRRRRVPRPRGSGDRSPVAARSSAIGTSSRTAPRASRERSRTGRCMRANPYQVLEGLSVAATVVHAREAFVAVKASFAPEIDGARTRAARDGRRRPLVRRAGEPRRRTRGVPLRRGEGAARGHRRQRPDAPLAAALSARPLRDDSARGLVARAWDRPTIPRRTGSNPTLVNNVESLANVPLILTRGADWYRTIGTRETPGPVDLHRRRRRRARRLRRNRTRDAAARGDRPARRRPAPGRTVKAVLSGVSNPVLTGDDLDAPVSYEGLAAAGGGLGSAGFIVFDDTRSMLAVARMVSRFLYVESCGQCRACKFGTRRDHTPPRRARRDASGDSPDIEIIGQRLRDVTNQNRCFLGEEEQRVISSLLAPFPEDFSRRGRQRRIRWRPFPSPRSSTSATASRSTTRRRCASSPTGPTPRLTSWTCLTSRIDLEVRSTP